MKNIILLLAFAGSSLQLEPTIWILCNASFTFGFYYNATKSSGVFLVLRI